MIAGPLRYPVDRARVRVVHPRIDLEPVTLASAIFPGGRAQIAQRHLALAAVEFRDLPEFRGVAFAGAAGETIEDASADAVDRVGATRLHQPELVKRLMREKRAACRGFRPAARRTRNESQRGECRQQQRSGIARRIPGQAGHVFSSKWESSYYSPPYCVATRATSRKRANCQPVPCFSASRHRSALACMRGRDARNKAARPGIV